MGFALLNPAAAESFDVRAAKKAMAEYDELVSALKSTTTQVIDSIESHCLKVETCVSAAQHAAAPDIMASVSGPATGNVGIPIQQLLGTSNALSRYSNMLLQHTIPRAMLLAQVEQTHGQFSVPGLTTALSKFITLYNDMLATASIKVKLWAEKLRAAAQNYMATDALASEDLLTFPQVRFHPTQSGTCGYRPPRVM